MLLLCHHLKPLVLSLSKDELRCLIADIMQLVSILCDHCTYWLFVLFIFRQAQDERMAVCDLDLHTNSNGIAKVHTLNLNKR